LIKPSHNCTDVDYHRSEVEIVRNINNARRIVPVLPGKSQRILEVGCGAGALLETFTVKDNLFLCGVDVDAAPLRLGFDVVKLAHFVQARGEALPFRSMEFDFVISRVSLPYMNIPEALNEMVRVLKSDGRLWMVLHPFAMVKHEFVDSARKLNVKDCVFRVYVMLNGLAMHLTGNLFPYRPGRYESFQTNQSITNALLAKGVVDIEIVRSRFFVVSGRKP
jgi:ubiquinone/menaquinone biosynthesis C-methylase UbiE